MTTEKTETSDVYRDSVLRLLGYSRHIGLACRPFIPKRIKALSYNVAMAYILADTIDKGIKARQSSGSMYDVAIRAGDALLWQYLASLLIPRFIIRRINYYTESMLRRYRVRVPYDRYIGCAVVLASIPFMVIIIDRIADCILDTTYRKCIK